MNTQEKRLAEIHEAIDAENVSLGELSELQDIAAEHPELLSDDPILAEAAGIPEEQWRQGMQPAKATPGPWTVTESFINNACNRLVIKRKTWGGEIVADLGEAPDANRANARLIAAAPDLLEALKRAVKHTSASWKDAQALDFALEAIAKADGGGQ